MAGRFSGLSDRKLNRLYNRMVREWERYTKNCFLSLANNLEPTLRELSTEIQDRAEARSDKQVREMQAI